MRRANSSALPSPMLIKRTRHGLVGCLEYANTMTVEDLRRELQRIPDEKIYPLHTWMSVVPEADRKDLFVKRPKLSCAENEYEVKLVPRILLKKQRSWNSSNNIPMQTLSDTTAVLLAVARLLYSPSKDTESSCNIVTKMFPTVSTSLLVWRHTCRCEAPPLSWTRT